MTEKPWIERAKIVINSIADTHAPDKESYVRLSAEVSKALALIALVEELKKTNAILARMEKSK